MDFAVPPRHFPAEMSGVLVAGGGLAGAAVATALARAGKPVTLVEREAAATDKICGEFLSVEAQTYLTTLGLDLAALGGHPITHLRLVRGGGSVTTALPFQGLGLSRKVLDEALLQHAAGQGARLIRGHAIRQVGDAGLAVDGIGTLAAKTLFLATGKHDLRGQKRDFAAPPLVGFKMYFALSPAQSAALASHVELIMFAGGYAGLQLVEGGKANLCLLVDRARLARNGGKFLALLADLCRESAHLAARLDCATPLLPVPLSIAGVPYGYIRKSGAADGIFRLGDQAGVIPSFTGDGMSIALHSAALAAETYLAGGTAAAFQQTLAGHITGQIRRAGIVSTLVDTSLVQPVLFAAAKAWPGALALAARLTRVPAPLRLSQQ